MSSGRFITIKLEPYYQEFLRSQFNQNENVFSFPRGHDLLMRLEFFLAIPPPDYIPEPTPLNDPKIFRIAVPFMEHKHVDTYTYLSQSSHDAFVSRIKNYYKIVIHDIISKSIRKGFKKTEIIEKLMEDFQLSDFGNDRIKKSYKRYLDTERTRRFRMKKNHRKLTS